MPLFGRAVIAMRACVVLVLLTLLFATATATATATAAADPDLARILLPIAIEDVNGAYGSVWTTELWYRNESDTPTQVWPPDHPHVAATSKLTLPLPISRPVLAERPGIFIYVRRIVADDVRFSVVLRDLSRGHEDWGTEIPVVRENDFRGGRVVLINVPTDSRFRHSLRIYEAGLQGAARVRIEIFPESPLRAPSIASLDVDLTVRGQPTFDPGYAQLLSLLDAFPIIRAADRVRVEITALTPGANLWAFVALTNNTTQHVALVTPQ
jgi:hypothetical protein